MQEYINENLRIAFALNKMAGLEPSRYFENLLNESMRSNLSLRDLEAKILSYYDNKIGISKREKEFDLVSIRMAELLMDSKFEFSENTLKEYNNYLFQGIYENAGKYRKYNVIKKEPILNGNSVQYGNYRTIQKDLKDKIEKQKEINYEYMKLEDLIYNISRFTSEIWQIHPFYDGNTRTTVLFLQKYLRSKKINVNNDSFKKEASYFRNALVRANYIDIANNIYKERGYLYMFFENLIGNKNNELKIDKLVV